MTRPWATRLVPDYLIRARIGDNDCYVDVEAYAVVGRDGGTVANPIINGPSLFERKGADSGMDTTADVEDAALYLSGHIKWDGCANLHFDEQDNCMLHFCGPGDVEALGAMLMALHELAREVMPKADWRADDESDR